MWAYRLTGPKSFERVEVPEPDLGALAEGQVLVRTRIGGICGSDIPKFLRPERYWQQPDHGWPLHEIVGTVEASRHERIARGQSVVGWASATDGLAEYVVTSGEVLHSIDQPLDPTVAVLIQPLACVLHACSRVTVPGANVAVIGLGPIGLMFTHVARTLGAHRVVGVDPVDRRGIAADFGVENLHVGTGRDWAARPDADRPDLVIETVGHQSDTLQNAMDAVAVEGCVLCFGIPDQEIYPLDMERLMRKNVTLVGGVTRRRRHALEQAAGYLARHPELHALISAVVPVQRVTDAYSQAATTAPDRLKVVLDMA